MKDNINIWAMIINSIFGFTIDDTKKLQELIIKVLKGKAEASELAQTINTSNELVIKAIESLKEIVSKEAEKNNITFEEALNKFM